MPSTYSAQNRFEEQNPGENLNTWGARLNAATTALIDFAISGYTALTLSGTITLSSANGTADQARSAILDFTSGTGGTVTIPSVSHVYQVRNNTSGSVVFTTGSGTTATVETGSLATVICDGTNCYRFADAADIAACLTAAENYATGLAFSSSSGVLPGQAGNAGNLLTTNGTTANWTPLAPQATVLASARNFSLTGVVTASAVSFNGSADAALTTTIAAGAVTGAMLATGAAASNIGFTPAALAANTFSGLQNLAAGATVTPAASIATNAVGYLGLPQTTRSANYTGVMGDAGTEQFFTASGKVGTIPSNASVAYPIGTLLVWSIASGSLTVAITSDTMTLVPTGTTGSRTVTGPGFLIARKISATGWWVYGLGVS